MKESLSVIHIANSDLGGGAAKSAYRLHLGLTAAGHASRMIVKDRLLEDDRTIMALGRSPEEDSELNLIAKYYLAPRRTGRLANTSFSLPPISSKLQETPEIGSADLINLHWVADFLSLTEIVSLIRSGRPVVWTLHDMRPFTGGCHFSDGCERFRDSCEECPQLQEDPARLTATAHRKAWDALGSAPWTAVCPSRWLADNLQASPMGRRRIEVIPYGIDTGVFSANPEENASRTAAGEVRYLCAGATWLGEKRKNIEGILSVLRKIASDPEAGHHVRSGRWQLMVFGSDDRYFHDTGWTVQSCGSVDSEKTLAGIYSRSRGLLFCSLADNLPNTILEAMSCGTPVVAFAAGGVPEMLTDGIDGFLRPAGDEEGLAQGCIHLLQDDRLFQTMSDKGRLRVRQRNALAVQASTYTALYRDLLAAAPAAAEVPLPEPDIPWRRQLLRLALENADEKVTEGRRHFHRARVLEGENTWEYLRRKISRLRGRGA